jgi:hypothetical protein
VTVNGAPTEPAAPVASPALIRCDGLIAWYAEYAARARDRYWALEVVLVVVSALIPIVGIIWRGDALAAAIPGAIVVILTALRHIFQWQENFTRFSSTHQALTAQRDLYQAGAPPYENPADRDQKLTVVLNALQAKETAAWAQSLESPAGQQPGK